MKFTHSLTMKFAQREFVKFSFKINKCFSKQQEGGKNERLSFRKN